MYLKIENINGTDGMLKRIEEAEQLIKQLRSIVSDLQFEGLSLDVTTEKTDNSD